MSAFNPCEKIGLLDALQWLGIAIVLFFALAAMWGSKTNGSRLFKLAFLSILGITIFYLAWAVLSPRNYSRFFTDDGFNEILTVGFELLAALFFLLTFFRLRKKRLEGACVYLLLAVFTFWVAGEELSWGQRIFNFSIPVFFLHYNDNQSVNIHNLFLFAPWEDEITLAVYLSWGIFLPAILFNWPKPAEFWRKHHLPSPWPLLSLGMALGLLAEFYPAFHLKDYAEYAYEAVETFFALSMFWVSRFYFNKAKDDA